MIFSKRVFLALLGVAVAGSTSVAQSWPTGWTYTMNMTTDSGDAARRSSTAVRQSIIPGKVRMELVQLSNVAGAGDVEGYYQIINSADSTVMMVMPRQRTATVMSFGGSIAKVTGPTKFATHTTQSSVEDLGAGDRILGHLTQHVRVVTKGTMDITMFGETCTAPMNAVAEMWMAPDVDFRDALESTLSTYSAALGPGIFEMPPDARGSLPRGTALRTINQATRPNAQGRMTTVTTKAEYVELAHGPIDPALFAAPRDFNVMDMRKMIADMPPGVMDSAMAATRSGMTESPLKNICKAIGGEP